ncbi:hypothetical protein LXL04_026452 [Taraxacum kok-saghyz]
MKYMKPLSLYQELLKSPALERGRLLGLDVGDKYVGLAVSDFNNKIVSPLSVLVRKKSNIDLMAIDFQYLYRYQKCLYQLLSLDALMIDRETAQATQVKVFVDELCKTGKLEGVRYTFWDECFTSKHVELLLNPLNFPPVEAKTISDKFAAVGILEGYLDYVNRNVELEQNHGYGGILRDEKGCWIRGFTGHLGPGYKTPHWKLQALEKPELYTKSWDWIAKISDCRKLVKKNEITLSSITPEENKCAKFLAQLAMDDDDGDGDEYADVVDPPPGIESLIIADKPKVSHD